MNLRLRKIERKVRRRLLAEVRASRSLRLERKRLRKGREYHLPPWFYRCLIFLAVLLFFTLGSRRLDVLVAMAFLWSLGTIFFRTYQFQYHLYATPNLNVLRHLPIANADIFTIQFKSFLRATAWATLDFILVYGVLAYKTGYGINSLMVGLAMGLMHALVMLALAVILLGYTRGRLYWMYGLVFMAGTIGLAISADTYRNAVSIWLTNHAYWIPPMGWTLNILGITRDPGLLAGFWPSISIGLTLLLMPLAYKRARAAYILSEPKLPSVPDPNNLQLRQAPALASSDPGVNDPSAAIKQSIRERKFLAPFDWKKAGWLERLAFRWMTREERLAAEFMSGGNLRWSAGFFRFTLICAACVAAFILFPQLARYAVYIGIYFAIYLFAAFSLTWKGFELKTIGGSSSPLQAIYPLSFWCLARMIMKVNLLRLVALPLVTLVLYVMMVKGFGNLPGRFVLTGLKIVLTFLALQPLPPIIPFSTGSNDTQRTKSVFLLVVGALILGGCVLALFSMSTFGGALAMFTVSSFVSTGFLLLYGRAYNRNWFDLMRKAQPKTNLIPQQ